MGHYSEYEQHKLDEAMSREMDKAEERIQRIKNQPIAQKPIQSDKN